MLCVLQHVVYLTCQSYHLSTLMSFRFMLTHTAFHYHSGGVVYSKILNYQGPGRQEGHLASQLLSF